MILRLAAIAVLGFTLSATPVAAAPHRHVRVVFDTSKSMRNNDAPRLAPLATLLLYDLVDPDLTLGDTFQVVPFFNRIPKWQSPNDAPPTAVGAILRPQPRQRDAFVDQVRTLAYDADWTYYYPGIKASLEDLAKLTVARDDLRAIVLVTDGLPEDITRDKEAEIIKRDLIPSLHRLGIRLYILAFGPEAFSHQDYFEPFVEHTGESIGAVFADPDGKGILQSMITIFGRSFGYTPAPPSAIPATQQLDLEHQETPERVAVVAFHRDRTPPGLTLTPPPGEKLNAPDGVQRAWGGADSSYSAMWVLSPPPGAFSITTSVRDGTVAVLRPSRVTLEVLPMRPGGSPHRAMARKPFPLKVAIKPQPGAAGPTTKPSVSFQTHGPRTGFDPATGDALYEWDDDKRAPGYSQGKKSGTNWEFEIAPEFPKEPKEGEPHYQGYLELEARVGEAVIGSLINGRAHEVEIYPHVAIAPSPREADALLRGVGVAPNQPLRRGEHACAEMRFDLRDSHLPFPGKAYTVRAVLGPQVSLTGPLDGAAISLDGFVLEVAGASGATGQWTNGRPLTEDEMRDPHQVCIDVGHPTQGTSGVPQGMPIEFTLLESPYDEFDVIEPFTLKALIATPTFLERWRQYLVPGALLLLVMLSLWYLRDRPRLPPDLRIATGSNASQLTTHPLPPMSLLSRILGLSDKRPLLAGEGGVRLGRLQAKDHTLLFTLNPARGAIIDACEPGEVVQRDEHGVKLQVRRLYHIRVGKASQFVRLEYQ